MPRAAPITADILSRFIQHRLEKKWGPMIYCRHMLKRQREIITAPGHIYAIIKYMTYNAEPPQFAKSTNADRTQQMVLLY